MPKYLINIDKPKALARDSWWKPSKCDPNSKKGTWNHWSQCFIKFSHLGFHIIVSIEFPLVLHKKTLTYNTKENANIMKMASACY